MSLSNYNPGQELSSINFAGMIGGPLSAVVEAQSQAALSTVDFIKAVGFTPDTEDETTGDITPGKPVYVTFKYPKMLSPYQPPVAAVPAVEAMTISNAGTGYANGNSLTVAGITITVTSVDANGAITAFTFSSPFPTNTASANAVGATGPAGTNAAFNVQYTPAVAARDSVPAVFEEMMLEVPLLTMMPIPHIRVDYCEIDFHAKITSMEFKRIGSDAKFNSGFSSKHTTSGSVSGGTGGLARLLGAKVDTSLRHTSSVEFKVNASFQRSVKEGHKIDKTYQLGVKVRASQDEMPGGMEKILNILEDAIVAQPLN